MPSSAPAATPRPERARGLPASRSRRRGGPGLARRPAPRRTAGAGAGRSPAVARAEGLFGFRVTGRQVDFEAASPRACVTFSEPLAGAGVDYADFVRVDAGTFPVEARDRQLCIDGLAHGSRYQVTLRAGLPSAAGERLRASVAQEVYVRDRTPAVRFAGRAYDPAEERRGGGAGRLGQRRGRRPAALPRRHPQRRDRPRQRRLRHALTGAEGPPRRHPRRSGRGRARKPPGSRTAT